MQKEICIPVEIDGYKIELSILEAEYLIRQLQIAVTNTELSSKCPFCENGINNVGTTCQHCDGTGLLIQQKVIKVPQNA